MLLVRPGRTARSEEPVMATFLYRLGHFSVRRRRLVLGLWLVLLVGVAAAASTFGGETSDKLTMPGTESQRAFDLLDARFPAQGGSSTRVVVAAAGGLVPQRRRRDVRHRRRLRGAVPCRRGHLGDGPLAAAATVSPDGLVGFGEVRYGVSSGEVTDDTLDGVEQALEPVSALGLRVEYGGDVVPGARARSRRPPR